MNQQELQKLFGAPIQPNFPLPPSETPKIPTGKKVLAGVVLAFALIGLGCVIKFLATKKQPPPIITKTPPKEAPAPKEPAPAPIIVAQEGQCEPDVNIKPLEAEKLKNTRVAKERPKAS